MSKKNGKPANKSNMNKQASKIELESKKSENIKSENIKQENTKQKNTKQENTKQQIIEQENKNNEIKSALKESVEKKNIDVHFENTDFAKSIDATAAPVILTGREKRKSRRKRKLSPATKVVLGVLGIAAVCIVIYIVYYLVHYKYYDEYKQYLSDYTVEQGHEYAPLPNSGEVAGFDLVAESGSLKLFTDTKTGYVAVYDKRNGNITYSNPLDADSDTKANKSNKAYLKSQMQVFFYNSDVKSNSFDSFTNSVSKKQYTYESIENGIRYNYTIGNLKKKDGSEDIHFDIPLEYRLCDDYIEVSVPAKAIREYGGGSIYRIQLLKFFGASKDDEDGYMVVPNASGSLINFNNGKTTAGTYQQYVYDIDPISQGFVTTENTDACRLPIFGICRENNSVLGSIESGTSNTIITAGISGVLSQYNYCFPTFVFRNVDNLRNFGDANNDVYVLEPELYDIDFTVRYSFLDEENKGYSGIANYYRGRLIEDGVLKQLPENENIPFYYDVISAIKGTEHFAGIQYLKTITMTTFEQAENIAEELKNAGISNQVMNLQGWFNGGYYHDTADNVSVIGKCGGKSGLSDLNDRLEELGGVLYGDVALQKVTYEDDDFNYSAEGARYYGAGYVASEGMVNPTTLYNGASMMYNEIMQNLLSPKFLPRYVGDFADEIEDINISGISLRDLGNTLISDKRRTEIINREEALEIVNSQFERLEKTEKRLMTSNANAYAWAYSDDIINVPLDDNNYYLVDESIPLYEMIIHGCISYGSTLLNFEDNLHMDKTILSLIEAGASPHFVFTAEESSKMKDTAMNRFYATTFNTWRDNSVDVYNRVNEALGTVNGSFITEHKILDNGLRKVVYDNGVTFFINYSDEELTADDGYSVAPLSYRSYTVLPFEKGGEDR